ncbi:MAG: nucleoside-diphosphate sugar epimerase [Rhodospirillaceae bacterium]|nr:nucleoside-diphosphate sugar epimerase [Rhodospirillaceae bacterium]
MYPGISSPQFDAVTTQTSSPLIWVLIDDRPGNAGQALGVAEALNVAGARPFIEKHIRYSSLGKLPNIVRGSSLIGVTDDSVAALVAPWPDVVIAAGRRTAPVARWIKKVSHLRQGFDGQAGKNVILAQIMNPGAVGAADFDLIAIPNHDCERPDGDLPNALRITGAPHRFSPARLAAESKLWTPRLAHMPRPYFALLVGGATRQRPFPSGLAADVGAKVSAMAKVAGGSVLLSTSRRTGPEAEAVLTAVIDAPVQAFLWGKREEGADNPYAGFLALADAMVVTGDSVSMCSEACANPGSVYIYAPADMVSPKHARLHRELYALGAARPFDGMHTPFSHAPLNAATAVAGRIEELITKKL